MMCSRQISVVIPTYNRRESLLNTLQALASQRGCEPFEVIVSIDGSQDGTKERLSNFSASYKLFPLWFPNSGRATACNRGALRATGDILLFFDDDMEPDPDCLSAHLASHDGATKKAVMGPIPFSPKASPTPLLQFLREKTDTVLRRLAQPDYTMGVRDFFTSNFSIPRALFFELGGFDQSFRLYGNEDVELACRLTQTGVPIVFNPHAIAHQHYSKDFRGLARDNIDKGRTAVLLAMKHPEVIGQLKLSQYYDGSRRWRILRAGLLCASTVFGPLADWLINCITYAEELRHPGLQRVYLFFLDYCFWLGVRRELVENREARQVLPRLVSRFAKAE